MAKYQINVYSDPLHQLFLGNSQDAGVAKLLESVLNQVLQAQVTEQVERKIMSEQMNAWDIEMEPILTSSQLGLGHSPFGSRESEMGISPLNSFHVINEVNKHSSYH